MSSHGNKPGDPHRPTEPGGRPLPDDEAIPVLTERLTLPSLELDISLPPRPPGPPAPAPAGAAPPSPAPAPTRAASSAAPPAAAPPPPRAAESAAAAKAAEEDEEIIWATIEERAREALLRELQPRLSAELDRQLRERLQPTFVRILLATVTELRPSIEAAVRDAVSRAVAAEIARQRPDK